MTTLPRSETVLIRREHLMTLLTAEEALSRILDDEDEADPADVVVEAGLYDYRAFTEAEIASGANISEDGEVFDDVFAPTGMLANARDAAERALGLIEDEPAAAGAAESAA